MYFRQISKNFSKIQQNSAKSWKIRGEFAKFCRNLQFCLQIFENFQISAKAFCRLRKSLKDECLLLAAIGLDAAENGPPKDKHLR